MGTDNRFDGNVEHNPFFQGWIITKEIASRSRFSSGSLISRTVRKTKYIIALGTIYLEIVRIANIRGEKNIIFPR